MKIGKLPACPDDDCQVLILFKIGPTKGGPHYIESYFSEPLGDLGPFGSSECGKYPIESIESWLIVDKSIFEEP